MVKLTLRHRDWWTLTNSNLHCPGKLEMLFELAHGCARRPSCLKLGLTWALRRAFLPRGLRGARASIVCVDTWQNQLCRMVFATHLRF